MKASCISLTDTLFLHVDYDSSDLFQHGLTCIGFRDTREKDRFLHQIDRIVKLHQDRAVKLRGRSDSGARPLPTSPTESVIHCSIYYLERQ